MYRPLKKSHKDVIQNRDGVVIEVYIFLARCQWVAG